MSLSTHGGSHEGLNDQTKKRPVMTTTTGSAKTRTGWRARTPSHIDTPPMKAVSGSAAASSGYR